jgi:NDP-sugar pyrophosphorylase family protein
MALQRPEDTDVLVLCGGLGKRLREVVQDVPKPMADIGGRPFLDILLRHVSDFGFRRFILCAGYMGEKVKQHFKDQKSMDIYFSEEDEPLGTGGAVKNAEPYVKSSTFIVMNGDSICKMDMIDLLVFHQSRQAITSIALVETGIESDYGSVNIDKDQRILGFFEKKKSAGYINAGVYVFDRDIMKLMPDGAFSLECDFFPNILERNVYGYVTSCGLLDIGTPERYERARKELQE